ncbi:DUF1003 domain-containing protein [Deinococcus detaillensis]|uniref:DUF1003 domain-containing protein n=2 Tax=Deinococcus detaillensis TaxID=2592048 RepID=A0A553V5C2_9DEIO|nr:DUF1003 domain-containing protein [Deinococcus detaillensis]
MQGVTLTDSRPDSSPDSRLEQLLSQNAAIHTLMEQQSQANLTTLHRPVERFAQLLSRPNFIFTALTVFLMWIVLNLNLHFFVHRSWDSPPFFWLQGLIGVLGLVITSTVLISQARQAGLAEQRSQLQLQIILLTEQRSAKIVALLEELRRDLPSVRDRLDEEADVMQQASDPHSILKVIGQIENSTESAAEQETPETEKPAAAGQTGAEP